MDNEERDRLLESIIARVADYRQGEIAPIDAEHILRWVGQFDKAQRSAILREVDRLLSQTYISRAKCKRFISKLAQNENLVGSNPKAFWQGAGLLRIQRRSQSQGELLGLLGGILKDKFQLTTDHEESTTGTYVYLDDVSFTGNQIKSDLLRWSRERNIKDATVHVVATVLHCGGEYYAEKEIKSPFQERGIKYQFWAAKRFENRLYYRHDAEVLWPTQLPDEEYVNRWRSSTESAAVAVLIAELAVRSS